MFRHARHPEDREESLDESPRAQPRAARRSASENHGQGPSFAAQRPPWDPLSGATPSWRGIVPDPVLGDGVSGAPIGRGASLPDGTRSLAQGSLGVDLSDVQVHANQEAGAAAHQMGFLAYSAGRRIFLPPEGMDDDPEHRFILLHEIAHIAQSQGDAAPRGFGGVHDPAEDDADAAAEAMLAGRPYRVSPAPAALRGFGATARRRRDGSRITSDICHENQVLDAAGRAGLGDRDAEMMYSGNWQRDLNQLLMPAAGGANPALFEALDVLHVMHFGRSLIEQAGGREAAAQEFGTYDPVEHIDNPGGLQAEGVFRQDGDRDSALSNQPAGGSGSFADADPRYLAEARRAGLEQAQTDERVPFRVDGSGLPVYLTTSRTELLRRLQQALELVAAHPGDSAIRDRALRLCGEALHVMQDFYAHSNFVEISINVLLDEGLDPRTGRVRGSTSGATPRHLDTYVHRRTAAGVQRDENLRTPGGREVMATGTFNLQDTAQSLKEKVNAALDASPGRPLHEGTDRGTEYLLSWLDRRPGSGTVVQAALMPVRGAATAARGGAWLRGDGELEAALRRLEAARGAAEAYHALSGLLGVIHERGAPWNVVVEAAEEAARRISKVGHDALRGVLNEGLDRVIGTTEEMDAGSTARTMTQPTHTDIAKDFDPHQHGAPRRTTASQGHEPHEHRHGGAWLAPIADRLARAASREIVAAFTDALSHPDHSADMRPVVMKWYCHPEDCRALWRPLVLEALRAEGRSAAEIRAELTRRTALPPSQQAPNDQQTAGGTDRHGRSH